MHIQLLLVLLFSLPLGTEVKPETGPALPNTPNPANAPYKCSQATAQRALLMREAEKNKYTVGRIEFTGNAHIRDNILRRRILLNEGDIFMRRNVLRTIQHLNRLKIIRPVSLSDFEIRLRKEEKTVDMAICFHERRN